MTTNGTLTAVADELPAQEIRADLIARGVLVPQDEAASPARAAVAEEREPGGTVEASEPLDSREMARIEIRARAAVGLPELSGKQVGKLFGRSERWGRDRIAEVRSSEGAATGAPAAARVEVAAATGAAIGASAPVAPSTTEPTPADTRHAAPSPAPDTASEARAAGADEAPAEVAEEPRVAAAPPGGTARAWPVLLLALPAFVAIWGGWVGLGEMAGFGPVNLLPGIGAGWTINTAITLPIGVEAYAAYALRVWLSGIAPTRIAQRFAMWSAIGSLVLGMAGQVAYHLMEAAGMTVAPWQITTFVSCLPVVVLGCGAALAHLLHNHGRS